MGVKVLTVLGTRPEAIKLFPLIRALEADSRFESRVCATGQHRELVDNVLRLAQVVPYYDLDLLKRGLTLHGVAAAVLTGLGSIFEQERFHWAVVQGDTTSAMAAALAAHHHNIPICHVEAGLRTGDLANPWPEEANRKIIAAVAAMHCAPTEAAARALLAENVHPETVHVTGNTGVDALRWVQSRLRRDTAPSSLLCELESQFAGRRIVTVTLHRRESSGPTLASMARAIATLALRQDVALVVPVHPNPAVGAILRHHLADQPNIALTGPLDYPDFVRLLEISYLILTDSGGVQEEAPAVGTPVLVLRETTERSEGVTVGATRIVGTQEESIVHEVNRVLDDAAAHAAMIYRRSPYGDGLAAERISNLLAERCSKFDMA